MYCTYILTVASMKMFLRSRQALFFSLFMPLIILFIFGSIDFDKPTKMHIGLATHDPSPQTAPFVDQVRSSPALTTNSGTLDEELAQLREGNRTAVLDVPDDLLSPPHTSNPADARQLTIYVNAGRPMEAQMAMSAFTQISDRVSLAAAHAHSVFTIKQQAVDARNFRYIEFLLPGIVAMAIMQMSVFSVAFVFTRYKEKGVLKRLMATPMRPSQFVTANIFCRLCMAMAQACLFVGLGIYHFKIHMAGSYWLLALCVVLGSLMFLGLGFTISGLSKTVETVPLLANILVFPMLFVGNIFFATSNMSPWLQSISHYLPLTYFANALRSVMTDGAGVLKIQRELIGMTVWAIILIMLAIYTFRFQEKEGA